MTPATLEVTTPSEREIVLTRAFAAPRRLVFDAWTRPELLRRSGMERGVAEAYGRLADALAGVPA